MGAEERVFHEHGRIARADGAQAAPGEAPASIEQPLLGYTWSAQNGRNGWILNFKPNHIIKWMRAGRRPSDDGPQESYSAPSKNEDGTSGLILPFL